MQAVALAHWKIAISAAVSHCHLHGIKLPVMAAPPNQKVVRRVAGEAPLRAVWSGQNERNQPIMDSYFQNWYPMEDTNIIK